MSRVWLVARHQFREVVTKRSFLLIMFSLPLFLVFIVGFGYLAAQLENNQITLGYVDQAGLLSQPLPEAEDDDVSLVVFTDRESAQEALDQEQINAYYVIPENYDETRQAELVFFEQPPFRATRHFENAVRLNLLAGQSPALVERTLSGASVTVRTTETNREFPGGGPHVGQLLPLVVAAVFSFLVMTTSGYMTEVLAEEKTNRTMEIIISSISPARMMTGKILGAVAIAALQLAVWVIFLVAVVWVGGNVLDIDWLQNVTILWRDVIMVILVSAPSYLAIAALMTIIGSTLVDSNDAQQAGSLSMLFLFLPIYLIIPIAANPNSLLSLIFSFFPGTSIVTLALRSLFIEVPAWQIGVAVLIALICAITLIWLAGKSIRMSMLRYGQPLRIRELFRLRGSKPAQVKTA